MQKRPVLSEMATYRFLELRFWYTKKNVVTKLALLRGKLDSSGYYLSGNTENRKICHQNKTKILENFLPSFLKSRGHGCSDFGMKRGKDY